MTINQRLTEVLNFYKKNATEFAYYLKVSRNTVVRVTKENKSPGIKLLKPLAEKGVNINWLLTGEGEMLSKTTLIKEERKAISQDSHLKETIEHLKAQLKDKELIIKLLNKK